MRGRHEYNNSITDIFVGCVFELPMTRKQKFELELIMLTRKFNGDDNLNLQVMLSQMIDQFIDLNRVDYHADRGLRPQNSYHRTNDTCVCLNAQWLTRVGCRQVDLI